MAAPVLVNFRVIERVGNKYFLAISNFGLNDSGFMVECEFDTAHEFPWGVRMIELRLCEGITYFNMMRDHLMVHSKDKTKSADEVFAHVLTSVLSSHLNGFYGATPQGTPIHLPLEAFEGQFSEQVFTMAKPSGIDTQFEFMPLDVDMHELYESKFIALAFNTGLPQHILNPTDNIASKRRSETENDVNNLAH